jgi:hypothetical protein
MNQITGERSQAIFAADGKARHWLVRAAAAAGVALLASWLIALALGMFGGFGSLPGLPESRPSESQTAGSQIQRAQPASVVSPEAPNLNERSAESSGETSSSAPVSHDPIQSRGQNRTKSTNPETTSNRTKSTNPETTSDPSVSPSPPAPTVSASDNGRHLGATKPTTAGKPAESPGNGPGGTGAPGQQR